MPGPIKPQDVAKSKATVFPEVVFDAFNELITQEFANGYATIKQDDVVRLMVTKGLKREDIYQKGWLNVEAAYQAAGWDVEYDKPGYNESYPATFTFRLRGQRGRL